MQQPQQEISCALPPVCGEPCSEVAHPVMTQSVCEAKQEQAMFARMYLNLLVCGFKIKTCAYERSMRVFWHESEAHVGCHWQADAFWDIALGVHPAHSAVQDQAWFLPFCMHHIEFAHGNSFIPAPPSLFYGHLLCGRPTRWRFLYPRGQIVCWALLRRLSSCP